MSDPVTAVNAAILTMNNEQLNQVIEAIKFQRNRVARTTARQINVGDRVQFKGRRGATVTGKVTKVNQKTLGVKCDKTGTAWRVTASLVKAAA